MQLEISNQRATPAAESGSHGRNGSPDLEARTASPTINRADDSSSPAFEGLAVAEAVLGHWRAIALAAFAFAAIAGAAGWLHWKSFSVATAQLLRYDSPNTEEVFHPRQVSPQTFALTLRSPEIARRVGAQLLPALSPEAVATKIAVAPQYDSDLLTVTATAANPQQAVDLANLYANEAVRFTQGLQSADAGEIVRYLHSQIADTEGKIRQLNTDWLSQPRASAVAAAFPSQTAPDERPSPLIARWQEARDQLVDLLSRYTDAHPAVQAQRAKLAAIETEMAAMGTPPPSPVQRPASPVLTAAAVPAVQVAATRESRADPELLRSQLQSLEGTHQLLESRLIAAQLFQDHPTGYLRSFTEAVPQDVSSDNPAIKIGALALFGGLVGFLLAAGFSLYSEFSNPRLQTAADVTRVTGLPVLATVGDLSRMNPEEQDRWAFRVWTALQSRLKRSPNQGIVCGIISGSDGEGRSTWLNLLARAAAQRGLHVLSITASASPENPDRTDDGIIDAGTGKDGASVALTVNQLAAPVGIAETLAGSEAHTQIHIPLPGWVWDLARRKQWQAALHTWSQIEQAVILVELPPASQPEGVLLAENIPNLIWLADSGRSEATTTRTLIETLRHARCDLVGAVINRESAPFFRNLFPRWLARTGSLPVPSA